MFDLSLLVLVCRFHGTWRLIKSQAKILSLPGIKKGVTTGLINWRLLCYRGDCRRYQNRAAQNLIINLKERTEPGPSDVDSGARSAGGFSGFYLKLGKSLMLSQLSISYETITRFSLGYVSGHRCSIAGNGPDHGCSKYGRRTRRHADGTEFF